MRTGWVILDYSGTLSWGAVEFGRPEVLIQALRDSRLEELGLSDLDRFWNELVEPTWLEGSTTPVGYATLIARYVHSTAPHFSEDECLKRARQFVSAYLEASAPDSAWKPVLDLVSRSPGVGALIASDHYAEATETIRDHLAAWGYSVRMLRQGPNAGTEPSEDQNSKHSIFLANSADLGAWKSTPRYWEQVRQGLPVPPTHVWIVDDYGANERAEDPYSQAVQQRQHQTLMAIEETWRVPVESFLFGLGTPASDPETQYTRFRERVQEVQKWLEQRLAL